jgi:RNA polymerase sigma-70 factor, ECF subfamily
LTHKHVTKGRISKGTFASYRVGPYCTIAMFRRKKRLAEQSPGKEEGSLPLAEPDTGDQSKAETPADNTASRLAKDIPAATLDQELAELYRSNAEAMFRYGLVLTRNVSVAQDAVQETFLKYFVQRQQGELKDDRAWLFRVLRNHILDSQKSLSSRLSVGLEAALTYHDSTQSPQQVVEYAEAISLALKVLSPRELQCVQLRAEGFSYKEIGSILGIVPGTVGTLLARSSEKLRKAFGEEGLPCEAL